MIQGIYGRIEKTQASRHYLGFVYKRRVFNFPHIEKEFERATGNFSQPVEGKRFPTTTWMDMFLPGLPWSVRLDASRMASPGGPADEYATILRNVDKGGTTSEYVQVLQASADILQNPIHGPWNVSLMEEIQATAEKMLREQTQARSKTPRQESSGTRSTSSPGRDMSGAGMGAWGEDTEEGSKVKPQRSFVGDTEEDGDSRDLEAEQDWKKD